MTALDLRRPVVLALVPFVGTAVRILVAATVVCLLAVSPAAAEWTQVQTPHYLLLGDASPGDIRRIARRFEQFHAVMERLLSRGALSFATPTVVMVFKNRSSFRPYLPLYNGRPQEIGGMALSGGVINYMMLDASGGTLRIPSSFTSSRIKSPATSRRTRRYGCPRASPSTTAHSKSTMARR